MRRTHTLIQVVAALMEDPAGRHWGYELGKRAHVRSGVMYPILQRLLEAGWLTDGWEIQDEITEKRPPRRYYELTGEGVVALEKLLEDARSDERFGALGERPA
jgi:PadR family transcriptional regulator PadR